MWAGVQAHSADGIAGRFPRFLDILLAFQEVQANFTRFSRYIVFTFDGSGRAGLHTLPAISTTLPDLVIDRVQRGFGQDRYQP